MKAKRIRQFAAALLVAVATVACAQSAPGKEDPKARLAKAEAMFQERCKKAGVFIHRTAENVEGILLMKLRSQGINYGDQFRMDDPYGSDVSGQGYITNFLLGRTAKGSLVYTNVATPGYRYAEAVDPKDGKRYRYTGSRKTVGRKDATAPNIRAAVTRDPNYDLNNYAFVLDKVHALGAPPRYGVTYDD
ncbi:MAG: hypothetical protein K9J42_10955, partial [Sulfuritalea sp.]|nr:hypothetical protein [Sulfuritalea sp.]